MRSTRSFVGALTLGCVALLSQACGGSDSSSGFGGTYSSVDEAPVTINFKSGGSVVMAAAGLGSSSGTYTVDGERIVVSIDNEKHIFLLDGLCLEDQRNIFGKMCKGGNAGEAANAAAASARPAPSGTYVASNADGVFTITFAPGDKLTLSIRPTIGNPETHQGTFVIEGSKLFATVDPGTSMVLTFVNNTYESSAFGLPMKFVKQ